MELSRDKWLGQEKIGRPVEGLCFMPCVGNQVEKVVQVMAGNLSRILVKGSLDDARGFRCEDAKGGV